VNLIKYIATLSILLFVGQNSYAQIEEDTTIGRYIQFSGFTLDGDSLVAVPFVHVLDQNLGGGTSSDVYGYFSFVAQAGDVIKFTAIGYKDSYFEIPDTVTQDRYTVFHMLTQDTVLLKETVIYPWPSRTA